MVWKQKEKELTPEEAVKMAKAELAPFWMGSPPLLAGVKNNGTKASAYPLDPTFAEQKWLLLFFDPTDQAGENALIFAKEWHRRFAGQELKVLAIMKAVYPFLKDPKALSQIARDMDLPFPLVSDANETLFPAFGVDAFPAVLLVERNRNVLKRTGLRWADGLELEMHGFFRSQDPGLPLLPPFVPHGKLHEDILRVEFGRGHGGRFPVPGFGNIANGFGSGLFTAPRPPKLGTGEIYLSGKWIQDVDRIVTSDPKAELGIECSSSRFGLVAKSLSKTVEVPRVIIEAAGVPLGDVFSDEHLAFDEEGQSCIHVTEGQLYHVIQKLPAKSRSLTLRFPMAERVQVALYGMRFSE